ncbi:hypothetical protein [Pseudorhodoferax sp.]|uniref:hypothetical protein n=1 Tax=Pseudorhodoferax sp. TaxID=1993553 RepID=UPI0039E70C4C
MTHKPIQLVVHEPLPGSYVWALMETDDRGRAQRTVRRSEDSYDSYEGAMAAGSHALTTLLQQGATA